MSLNSGSPIIGRLASEGLGFLSSTWGLPVAGLIGSLSQTTTPQIPPLHRLTRTLASPACVSQTPLTSPPACASAPGRPYNAAKAAITKPNLKAMEFPKKQVCIAANPVCAMPYPQPQAALGLIPVTLI